MLLASSGVALGADGRLPGGTPLSVSAKVTQRSSQLGRDRRATVSGIVSLGRGRTPRRTTLLYVIDISGSTAELAGGNCGPDQNASDPESIEDEIIDCEIASAIKLNDVAATKSSIDRVGLVAFAAGAVVADSSPKGGANLLVGPSADANHNGVRDATETLRSILVADSANEESGFTSFSKRRNAPVHTNFAAGIRKVRKVAAEAGDSRVVAVLLSDGVADRGPPVAQALRGVGQNIVFHTFAVGAGSRCSLSRRRKGSLRDIARLTGGTCTRITDPSKLPSILPRVVTANLRSVEIKVGGGEAAGLDNRAMDPDLPQRGPVTVRYRASVRLAGRHQICVTATGSDAGGTGRVTECARPTGGVDTGAGGRTRLNAGRALRPTVRAAYAPATRNGGPLLVIPRIGLRAPVVSVGLKADGSLEVPSDFERAGWYRGSSLPGRQGPAIILGHFDSRVGPAVFYRLRELEPGDQIVIMIDSTKKRFVVERLTTYPKDAFPTARVYGDTSRPTLRLITCAGAFDRIKRSYRRNLVVFAALYTLTDA